MSAEHDRLKSLVDQHVSALREHFDSVVIMVSVHDGVSGNTEGLSRGSGNYYAQVGQVNEFLERDKAQTQINEAQEGN